METNIVEKTISKLHLHLKKLIISALFLALALVLPFLTGQIPEIGGMLCPMHFPVLLCGFVCGWQFGFAVGAIAPLLRHFIFAMPPLMAAIPMAFELAVYGLVCGLLYVLLPKKNYSVYISLIISMILGRLVWGAVKYAMTGLSGSSFSLSAFWAGAVTTAIPGIVLQILIVPAIVILLKKAKLELK